MSTYTVTAERSGKWWVLQAKEAPGAISQVARLDQAEQIIEAISFVTGEAESDIEITVIPIIPREAEQHMTEAKRLRDIAAQANTDSAKEARAAAQALRGANITLRDIGKIMSVSHQRAQQLIDG